MPVFYANFEGHKVGWYWLWVGLFIHSPKHKVPPGEIARQKASAKCYEFAVSGTPRRIFQVLVTFSFIMVKIL